MKLLVADDDPVYCRLLQRLLRDDYEVVIAYNGQDAWEILQLEDGPCLAVLNWVMPDWTGRKSAASFAPTLTLPLSMSCLLPAGRGWLTSWPDCRPAPTITS